MISKANIFLKELFDIPFTNTTETSAFYLSLYSPHPFTHNSSIHSSLVDNSTHVLKKYIIHYF